MKCGFLFFATTFAQCEEFLKFPLLLQSQGQQSKQASFETGTPITLPQKDVGNLFSATESKNNYLAPWGSLTPHWHLHSWKTAPFSACSQFHLWETFRIYDCSWIPIIGGLNAITSSGTAQCVPPSWNPALLCCALHFIY